MQSILDEIVAHKRVEVDKRKSFIPLNDVMDQAQACDGEFLRAISGEGLKLITEIKPSSPSAGVLRSKLDLDRIMQAYNKYASAISVLTDRKYFGGSLELLSRIAMQSSRPVLCKDFVLDPYQVYEARAAGAHAVLLMVKVLDDEMLSAIYEVVCRLSMTAVVEIQNACELERSVKIAPRVLMINNRNLTTMEIDLKTTARLAPMVPEEVILISASGIIERRHIEELLPVCSRFLIGSVLMQCNDIDEKLKELACEPGN